MVLEFLKAEADSPRWGQHILNLLQQLGKSREELLDRGDLQESRDNQLRLAILDNFRGYSSRRLLFARFPSDAKWCLVELSFEELANTRFISGDPNWMVISSNTRSVSVAAANIAGDKLASLTEQLNAQERRQIRETARAIRDGAEDYSRGCRWPLLIGATVSGNITIIEGHIRATAIILSGIRLPRNIFLSH